MLDWFETVLLNNVSHTVKIDTGAQANVISQSILQKLLPDVEVQECRVVLSAYGGSKIPVVGKVKIKWSTASDIGQTETVEFIVVKPVASIVH